MLISRNSKDGESMCGLGGSTAASADPNWIWNDKFVDVDVTVPHVGAEATLKAFTNLQDSDEFWGIGAVKLAAVSLAAPPPPPSPPGTWSLVAADTFPTGL